ncbi:hypothetical protein GALMADRAFT_143282 [Galerina marginata CBS 339.88]|uniref:Uncharacterized protein n=1 Tax=Galerina marginata (strain CBS 339.88) TaxID=685588 RepID=A0A067SR32_GALM3|nr:hypothetical protein GALMADRAFT_143282 [Galerina marginata CBS 339.88]
MGEGKEEEEEEEKEGTTLVLKEEYQENKNGASPLNRTPSSQFSSTASRQSRSQPSSFGRSKGRRHSIATSISLLDVYPSPNKEEPSHNSSAAAFHRNLNVDTSSSFIQRRKAIHSFASMDSGLDLAPSLASNTEEPHPELGPDRVNGFDVIARLAVAHPLSPSPSPNPHSTRPPPTAASHPRRRITPSLAVPRGGS